MGRNTRSKKILKNKIFFKGWFLMYKCGKCGEKFNKLPDGMVRCPVCAHKVLYKSRVQVAKHVPAR